MLELVSSDSLNVPSEEDVYRAVLSWVKHDVDARRQHVPRVRPGPGGRDGGRRGGAPSAQEGMQWLRTQLCLGSSVPTNPTGVIQACVSRRFQGT